MNIEIPELSNANDVLNTVQDVGSTAMSYVGTDLLQIIVGIAVIYFALRFLSRMIGKLSFLIVLVGLYLVLRGTVDLSLVTNAIEEVPGILNAIPLTSLSL